MDKIEGADRRDETFDDIGSKKRVELKILLGPGQVEKLNFSYNEDRTKYWLDLLRYGKGCCDVGICKDLVTLVGNSEDGYNLVKKEFKAIAELEIVDRYQCRREINYPFELVCWDKIAKYSEIKERDLGLWNKEDADIVLSNYFLKDYFRLESDKDIPNQVSLMLTNKREWN
ncbi:hypothetical protein KJ855_03385 [Patescibacteria group bacterium]|nr:hypothetical protein [Patescibacteria group bacterium]